MVGTKPIIAVLPDTGRLNFNEIGKAKFSFEYEEIQLLVLEEVIVEAVRAVTAVPEKGTVVMFLPVNTQSACSTVSKIPSLSSSISITSAVPSLSVSKQALITGLRAKLI